MAKQAITKILRFGENGMHIYIPATIRNDSQNPFIVGDTVTVSIDCDRFIVEHFEVSQ